MKIFSDRLKYERKNKGFSQREMAEKLGLSQSAYKAYELLGTKNGCEPSLETINKIADILDVSIDYLFGRED